MEELKEGNGNIYISYISMKFSRIKKNRISWFLFLRQHLHYPRKRLKSEEPHELASLTAHLLLGIQSRPENADCFCLYTASECLQNSKASTHKRGAIVMDIKMQMMKAASFQLPT